ncbi:N-acetylmuramoyl-L-alanine amidase [Lentilactobacillus sp. Marseille-Q4993]|uniref:peptidoglycan recognition protein family protein n=1 Tax=Lentilactobacillus sp. Marseille-Q4993 TaxID=3039492 RepID=UPI0024BCE456|nr:N-acetylmuramoyl-L-alanine amidase [Lentilactobacillus sp. Marseille-Q4993]
MNKKGLVKLVIGVGFALGGVVIGSLGSISSSASAVNNYVLDNNLQPAKVTSQIWSGFPKNNYLTANKKPNGVVVHETANPNSTIYNEIAYMKNNYQNAFVHTFVDASRVIAIANPNYLSWGCGYPGNGRFIQFEQVEVHSKDAFAKEVNNAANYTAEMLHQYNLPLNNAASDGNGSVWSHKAVSTFLGGTDHGDPDGYYAANGNKYFGSPYTMSDFYALVKHYYNSDDSSTSSSTTDQDDVAVNNDKVDSATSSSESSSQVSTTPTTPTIKYYKGQGNETAKLSGSYSKYRLYNHVKGSGYNVKQYSFWGLNLYSGKKVYVDGRAKKNGSSTWYRIRFSKSSTAKKYWMYSKALSFNPVSYSNSNKKITIKSSKYALRNHVYNSAYLSKVTGSTASLLGKTFKASKVGLKSHSKGTTNWYRFSDGNNTYWVCEQALA